MNIYTKNGLQGVINASGRMTKLGVSTISDEVAKTLVEGAQNYVVIDDLLAWAGKQIASYIGCEDVCVTSSASAGMALSIASLFCKDNLVNVKRYQETVNHAPKKEVILLKGHNVDYGAPIDSMIQLAGATVKEVGYANKSTIEDITNAVNEQTLAIMFVKSHHCVQKNMVGVKEVIEAANRLQIPCIVDASAEEDLCKYHEMGADFVCYSGAKAISGPTSGFVACKHAKDAENMRLQYKGIGRAMKIGKENCMGLVKAVEIYQANHGYVPSVTLEDLKAFAEEVKTIPGLTTSIIQDEAGRAIYRCKVTVDENVYGVNAKQLISLLGKEDPGVFVREHLANLGSIAIDPRPLKSKDELTTIFEILKKIGK